MRQSTDEFETVTSSDSQGVFEFKIVKGRPCQMQISTCDGDDNLYANMDKGELSALRDAINAVIENY